MASFGDNTTTFMRGGVIQGGLKVETGCWTQLADESVNIPTRLTQITSLVLTADGTTSLLDVPDVSSGNNIKGTLSGSGSGLVINYAAFGW